MSRLASFSDCQPLQLAMLREPEKEKPGGGFGAKRLEMLMRALGKTEDEAIRAHTTHSLIFGKLDIDKL